MEFKKEIQNGKNYLVYGLNEQEIDSFVLGMITNTKIECLLPARFTQIDDDKLLKFSLSSKDSLTNFLSRSINKRQLLGILRSMCKAFLEIDNYMLFIENLVLDTDYIYVDVSSFEIAFVCLPIKNQGNPQSIQVFFKSILNRVIPDPSESNEYFALVFGYLNSHRELQIEDFKLFIEGLYGMSAASYSFKQSSEILQVSQNVSAGASLANEERRVEPEQERPAGDSFAKSVAVPQKPSSGEKKSKLPPVPGGLPARPHVDKPSASDNERSVEDSDDKMSLFYLLQHYNSENADKYKRQKASKKEKPAKNEVQHIEKPAERIGFEEARVQARPLPAAPVRKTVVEEDFSSPTVDLSMVESDKQTTRAFLRRIKTNERIEIDKAHFKIGKERNYADYCPTDILGLSRSHANIVTENDGYYITDTNSTNHTYLDGAMIPGGQPFKLESGMIVRFANEEFEFIIQEN